VSGIEELLPFTASAGGGCVWLRWSLDDPCAVRMTFGDIEWHVARDLLRAGCDAPVGAGDISIEPVGRSVAVHLTATADDECDERVLLPRTAVRRFLDRTYRVVRRGAESYDVDAVIAACLKEVES
jgi:hypothetical protein